MVAGENIPEFEGEDETSSSRKKRGGRFSSNVEVKILSFDKHDNRYLVYETANPEHVYLISVEHLANDTNAQKVSKSVIQESVQPYDWTEELETFTFTRTQMRHAILRSGYIVKDESVSFKKILVALMKDGIMPIGGN